MESENLFFECMGSEKFLCECVRSERFFVSVWGVRSYCVSLWGVRSFCVGVWGVRIYCVSVCFACTATQEVNTTFLWGSLMEVFYTDNSSVAKFKQAFFKLMFFEHPAFSAPVRFIFLCHPVNQYGSGVG